MKKIYSFLLIIFFNTSNAQDFSKYNYFLKNRILNDAIDLNDSWKNLKIKSSLAKVNLSEKDKNEILLKNYMYTPQKVVDTLKSHFVYYKAHNEKAKIIFGEKFDNLFVELDIFNSFAYRNKPSGNINISFYKKFTNKLESKRYYLQLIKLVEKITNKSFSKAEDSIKFKDINWQSLYTNENNISIFNFNNSVLLSFNYYFLEDSWPLEASYDEFSENFKLFDKFKFFNGFKFNNSVESYMNVLNLVQMKEKNDYNVYEINTNIFRKNIAGIQFDDGFIFEKDKKIFEQIYILRKSEANKINTEQYIVHLNKLFAEYGYGCLDITSEDEKVYYWRGNNVMISFECNYIDEYYRLVVVYF